MGDFFLDLRPREHRTLSRVSAELRFLPHLRVAVIDQEDFGVVVTYTGEETLWSPYVDPSGSICVVAGFPVFDDTEWRAAERLPGPGGLAAKAVWRRYVEAGVEAAERLDGNCVAILFDASSRRLVLVGDCSGAFPSFECETATGWVVGSHPDVVARSAGEERRLDETSLTEFVLRSTVTPPYTYYQRVRASEPGTTLTFDRASRTPVRRRYFTFEYRGDERTSESELAECLSAAFRRSVRRRTDPRLGTAAVALSGGLDSRALLACVEEPGRVFSFCLFNEPNNESRTAGSIAEALGVRFLPMRREFEYYGDSAEMGVKISGGMGTFANNHFLVALERLRGEGMSSLLTGCYCDYLFKALPLNRRTHWLTGREELDTFREQFYFGHHLPAAARPAAVRARWEERVPLEFRRQDTPGAVFQVEARRTFPLCYEGDNQQRVVPQRVTGWCLPVADREILEIYCRIPYRYKLGRSLFLKTVRALCGTRLSRIPDANTGARLGASRMGAWLTSQRQRAWRKLSRSRSTISTEESWPNWGYYVAHSRKLDELWRRPSPEAFDFYRRTIGDEHLLPDARSYVPGRPFFFVTLLSLKLWFDNRLG